VQSFFDELGRSHKTLLSSRVRPHLDHESATKWSIGVVVGNFDLADVRLAVDGSSARRPGWDRNFERLFEH